MDSIEYAEPETINGLNLYAYCGNNPVMGYDPDGTWNWKGFGMIMASIAVVAAVTAAVVVTAGAAAVAVGATAATVSAVTTGAAVGGLVAGGINLTVQAVTNGAENINYSDLAFSTFVGATSGAISGGMGELSSGVSAGTKLLAHKGMQATANVIISDAFYIGQSVLSGSDVTLDGLAIATAGGFVSGVAFNMDVTPSIFLSMGLEFASYNRELPNFLKRIFAF